MINIQKDVLMSNFTTLGIGGPARLFFQASTNEQIIEVVKWAKQKKLDYLVIGGASNLLVADSGVNALVIKNEACGISKNGEVISVKAGTDLQDLVDFTISEGFSGMQRLTGIPGTVGGAVFGNAGAYGQTISDFLTKVICFDPSREEELHLLKDECKFEYRDSGFKTNQLIITEVEFRLPKGKGSLLLKEARETLKLRQKKYHPGIRCPGSFFRNYLTSQIPKEVLAKLPPRVDTYGKTPAYIFLESLGAKGDRIGDIEIAPFHANLFINKGGGTASDFYKLAKKWFLRVKKEYEIELEPEVQLINLPKFKDD